MAIRLPVCSRRCPISSGSRAMKASAWSRAAVSAAGSAAASRRGSAQDWKPGSDLAAGLRRGSAAGWKPGWALAHKSPVDLRQESRAQPDWVLDSAVQLAAASKSVGDSTAASQEQQDLAPVANSAPAPA